MGEGQGSMEERVKLVMESMFLVMVIDVCEEFPNSVIGMYDPGKIRNCRRTR